MYPRVCSECFEPRKSKQTNPIKNKNSQSTVTSEYESEIDNNSMYSSMYQKGSFTTPTLLGSVASSALVDSENVEYRRKILTLESAIR